MVYVLIWYIIGYIKLFDKYVALLSGEDNNSDFISPHRATQ